MTLSQETARKLRLMKMGEIVDIVESQDAIAENWNMNFHERIDNLVDQLYQIKNNKRIDTLCRQARFKWPKADVQSMLFTQERELHMASETGQVCANWRTAGRRLADSKNRDVNFLITAS